MEADAGERVVEPASQHRRGVVGVGQPGGDVDAVEPEPLLEVLAQPRVGGRGDDLDPDDAELAGPGPAAGSRSGG